MTYFEKYKKYKLKYLNLKKILKGGSSYTITHQLVPSIDGTKFIIKWKITELNIKPDNFKIMIDEFNKIAKLKISKLDDHKTLIIFDEFKLVEYNIITIINKYHNLNGSVGSAGAGAGDSTRAGAGDSTRAGAGDGTRAGAGDSTRAGAGAGTRADAGDSTRAGAGDSTRAGAGAGTRAGAGASAGVVAGSVEGTRHHVTDKPRTLDHLYYHPYEGSSRKLYVALIIDPNKHIGRNIIDRIKKIDILKGTSYSRNLYQLDEFGNYNPSIQQRIGPHISLLTIDFPENGEVDEFLKKDDALNEFIDGISIIIKEYFNKNKKRIHSLHNNYELMGNMIARIYNNIGILNGGKDLSSEIFSNEDHKNLLDEIIKYIHFLSSLPLLRKENMDAVREPLDDKRKRPIPVTYNKYYYKKTRFLEVDAFAISSDTTNFLPHLSIINTVMKDKDKNIIYSMNEGEKRDFIVDFKKASREPLSIINLWKGFKSGDDTGDKINEGNLSHIYISYGNNRKYVEL
jgi:hypothetical protein